VATSPVDQFGVHYGNIIVHAVDESSCAGIGIAFLKGAARTQVAVA